MDYPTERLYKAAVALCNVLPDPDGEEGVDWFIEDELRALAAAIENFEAYNPQKEEK